MILQTGHGPASGSFQHDYELSAPKRL